MTTTPDTFTNYATSTVAGGAGGIGSNLAAGDTTLFVQSGDGAKYPSVAPFMLQLGTLAPFELARCTSRSGDVLTIQRGQEGTSAATWAVGVTVEQVATAGNLANLWAASSQVFNVLGYGAKGNGTADDTAAVQATITACQNNGGGVVYLPSGTYLISATLVISADNVAFIGAGWGAQLLASATFPAGPMLWYQGPGVSNTYRYGCLIAEVFFNGANVAGVGAIQLDSTYSALIEHCRIRYCIGTAIYLNGISGAFGAYTSIRDCHISDGQSGTAILTNNHEWSELMGGIIAWFDHAGGMGVMLNNYNFRIVGVAFDECDTTVEFHFANRCTVVGCQFDRGHTRFIYLSGGQDNTISGNVFGEYSGSGANDMIYVDASNNARNLVANNATWAGSASWTNFVHEAANTGGSNIYTHNNLHGLGMVLQTGVARHNTGYNPYESLATPAAPTVSNAATGGTVAAGTYQVEVTLVSASGETAASASASTTTTGATSTLTVTSPTQVGNATGWYAYVTQPGGSTYTRQQTAGSPSNFGSNLTLTAPPTNTGATAPGANTTADVTTPAVPATTVAVQNTTGVDVTVYVSGGTVSVITIGGKATGLTSGAVRLPARQTIALTYSAVPSWTWIGE